jgi:hypothetical protein
MSSFFNGLKHKLIEAGFKLSGSTEEDINATETGLGFALPAAIREFLELTGDDYDFLYGGGTSSKLRDVPYNVKLAKNLLDKFSVDLSGRIFPFTSYSDDLFFFVYPADGDDPPVYRFESELWYRGDEYIAGSSTSGLPRGVTKLDEHFSNFISGLAQELIEPA